MNKCYSRKMLCFYLGLLLLSVFFVTGCGLFPSPYDAFSYEHLTSLKAYHLKFIDDFTEAENKQWDEQAVMLRCDEGNLRFEEAKEYEKEKKREDKYREKAIEILHEQFNDNCEFLKKKKHLFGQVFAEEMRKELEENYGKAIEGELIRKDQPD